MAKFRGILQLLHSCLLCVALGVSFLAHGASVQLDNDLFGHLDQGQTACAGEGCGPTAVVNSFVYLQNYYGALSGLIKAPVAPDIVTDFSDAGLVSLANTLATLMGCSSTCGTSDSALNKAKQTYLDGHSGGWVPVVMWDPTVTFKWLSDNLKDGVDIEMLVSDGSFGHYITVTGYTDSTLTFIDPSDGKSTTQALSVDPDGNMTLTNYHLDAGNDNEPPVKITDGFSESLVPSPVPEPEIYSSLGMGFALVAWLTRRKNPLMSRLS